MKCKLKKKKRVRQHFYIQYAALLEAKCYFLSFRVVEKGYYSERDAADAVKQVLEAVAVSL